VADAAGFAEVGFEYKPELANLAMLDDVDGGSRSVPRVADGPELR